MASMSVCKLLAVLCSKIWAIILCMTAGIEIDDMPHLQAWLKRIEERPGVKKGLDVPDKNPLKEMMQDPQKQKEATEKAQKMMVSHK